MALREDHKDKIQSRDDLLAALHRHRLAGRTIVHCHGCFDIVHPGHIRYLEFASRQGDILVVTLTGDADISKSDQRPYIPQELRAESLAALQFVDYVHVDPSPTAETVLETFRPDIYVKGREYATSQDPRFLREQAIVESYGGRVIFSSGEVVFSSSRIIADLPRQIDLEAERLGLVCRRHGIDHQSLSELRNRFSRLRVGVIGDVIIDRYVFCDATDVATESPMMSLARQDEKQYLGGAAIVARQVAALGAQTTFISCSADNDQARWVEGVLEEEGVNFQQVCTRRSLVEKTRYLVGDKKLLKVDAADVVPLDSVAEKHAARLIEQCCGDWDAVILCDFGYGTLTPSLLQRVLPVLRARTPIISADVSGSRGNLLEFRNVDVLCPTEREMRHTLHDFEAGLSSVAYQILSRTQARHLVCTLGGRGLVAFDRPSQDPANRGWSDRLLSEHFPAFGDTALDCLGCGDALLSGLTMGLAAKGSLMQASYLGNVLAAIKVGRMGNEPIPAADVESWLARRTELVAPQQNHASTPPSEYARYPVVDVPGTIAAATDAVRPTAPAHAAPAGA